jgi:hypothetical protein
VFGLFNGFIDHLYARPGTTSNYRATANLHSSQIIIATTCCVFTSRSLATASNSGSSSTSRARFLPSQSRVQNSSEIASPLLVTSRHGSRRQHRSSIVAFVSVTAGTCLRAVAQKRPRRRPHRTQFFYCCVCVCTGPYLAMVAVYRVTA